MQLCVNKNIFIKIVNLNLGEKVVALICKYGCEKSTLAKLIAGLYQAQSGNISFGIYNQHH